MKFLADLHLHSKFSRAVSSGMIIPQIYEWALKKGLNLIGTGDFTHPGWFSHLKENLKESSDGFFTYKDGKSDVYFVLSCEISSIYSQGDKVRRIHNLVILPSFESVEKLNRALSKIGNLASDGRPILGISSKNLAEIVFSEDPKALLIPAHAWTPWFSLYGSNSGFDSIEECFGDYSNNIYAVETGLSSDPSMNWRIAELDKRQIVSFSDAHSLVKLGREATVFDIEASFNSLFEAIKTGEGIKETIEFFPEEGKYHFTGHRNCQVKQSPEETKGSGTICPACGRDLTVGVMHRVEVLASRGEGELKIYKDEKGFVKSQLFPKRPKYKMLISLDEILAEALGVSSSSKKVMEHYNMLTSRFGSEIAVLLKTNLDDISRVTPERVSEGIGKVRRGEIFIDPGFDGVYGKVKIWQDQEKIEKGEKEQLDLFR